MEKRDPKAGPLPPQVPPTAKEREEWRRVKRNFHAKERKKKRELKAQEAKGSSSHDAGRTINDGSPSHDAGRDFDSEDDGLAEWLTTDEGFAWYLEDVP